MISKLRFSLFVVFSGWVSVSYAEAPVIQGQTDINITLESVTNIAAFDDSVAQVIIGSFLEGEAQGGFKSHVSAGFITNAAVGSRSCAQIIIGSVAGNLPCLSQ